MIEAVYQRSVRKFNRTDQREVERKMEMGTQNVDLPTGDENASVNVTRGLKTWFSTREAGMTVESTVSVQLTCGQSEGEIRDAAEEAGRLAESLALEGSEEMGMHLEPLMEGSAPGPSRRSEHPKHRRGRR